MISPTTIPPMLTPATVCLDGKVILVTGANGSLGRTAALAFARHGATVVLHGRNAARLDPIYDEIEAAGKETPAMLMLDFLRATDADFKGMADAIHQMFQRLDGIFHAAGHIAPLTPLALQDLPTWEAHVRINLLAPLALTRACLPMLKRAPHASVVFLSESHATNDKAFWGAFAVSKSALHHAAAIWNDELEHESALRMRVLVPGPVASQCRAVTHPGEAASELASIRSLERVFLLLMSADPRLPQSSVFNA